MEGDIARRFSKTLAYADSVSAIEALVQSIADKEAEVAQIDADLAAAVASGNHQGPADSEYRTKVATFEAAREAYEACVEEKEALCAEIQRLTKELERCEKEAAIAKDIGEAESDKDDAEADSEAAREDLEAIPEDVRGGSSPAGTKAREAEEKKNKAEAAAEAAEEHTDEAEKKVREGDPEGAAEEAKKAQEEAAKAKAAAEEAKRLADEARDLAEEEESERRLQEMEERRRQLRELERWQKKRKAAIDYLIGEAVQDMDGQLSPEDLQVLRDTLAELIDLGNSARDGMEELQAAGASGAPDIDAFLDDLQNRLDSLIGPLEDLKDKIDGFADVFEKIVEVKTQLDIITTNADSPQERARQFGAWLNLVAVGLDETVGNVPIVQFVTAYFSFLVDGYFAALDGIDQIERNIAKSILRGNVPMSCGKYLMGLCEGKTIDDFVEEVMARVRSLPDNVLDRLNLEIVEAEARAQIAARIAECARNQLKEPPPPIKYTDWVQNSVGSPQQEPGTAWYNDRQRFDVNSPDPLNPLANLAGDGIPNFAKFALGMDLERTAEYPFTIANLPFKPLEDAIGLRFTINQGAQGVARVVEWSSSLAPDAVWSEIDGITDIFPGTNREDPAVVYFFPEGGSITALPESAHFFRLRIIWEAGGSSLTFPKRHDGDEPN